MHRNDPPFDDPTYSAMSIAVKEKRRPHSGQDRVALGRTAPGWNRSCVSAPVRLPDRRGQSRTRDRTCPVGSC